MPGRRVLPEPTRHPYDAGQADNNPPGAAHCDSVTPKRLHVTPTIRALTRSVRAPPNIGNALL
jgi:hypothetical protein